MVRARLILLAFFTAASVCACRRTSPEHAAAASERAAQVTVTHLPSPAWTVTEGVFVDPASNPPDAHADSQNLTWLFHLVLSSKEAVPLAIDAVDVTFSRG